MGFSDVVAETRCPFADLADWREGRLTVPPGGDPVRALADRGADLRAQVPTLDEEQVDMVVLEIVEPSLVEDLASFTTGVRAFVTALHGAEHYRGGELVDGEEEWLLVVAGVRLFAFTFGPFYSPRHPRHSPNGSAYIVVQLLHSFRKIGMHQMTLGGKRRLSDRVRSAFEDDGIPYFADITQRSPEVLKMVKPLREGDPPIRWWA